MSKVIKSTITSKGQITLPKTIRELMNLNTGDQVVFTLESNNKVIMEKESNIKNQSKMNLISLLLEVNPLIVIRGNAGSGKTTLTKHLLINQFLEEKVAVIEPINENYHIIEQYMKDLTRLDTEEGEGKIIPHIIGTKYNLIVVEESDLLNFEVIKEINKIKQKMILVNQLYQPKDLIELGSHISITVNRNGLLIEKYELLEGEFIVTPIYID